MNEVNQHNRLSSTPYQFTFKICLKYTTESNAFERSGARFTKKTYNNFYSKFLVK